MKATISILVPAAGCGSRAGANGNKILAPLCGQPLLWHTLRALDQHEAFPEETEPIELIIAARHDEWELIQPIFSILNSQLSIRLVEGGSSRQESVYNVAKAASGDLLLVHDAARPFVSAELILRVVKAALQNGAALAALPCPDTVKQADNGFVAATLDRSILWLAQTPQVFRRTLLLEAFENARRSGFAGTDCASLVEHLGQRVQLVPGEARNFKVTYPDDLARAEMMLKAETYGK